MATKKRDLTQAAKKAAEAKFKKDHAKLYKAGLVKKPAREQKMTRHAKGVHARLNDFLAGKAQVVSVPRGKAKEYKEKFPTVGNKVVVPIGRKGERARYNKKEGEIISTRREGGIRVQRQFKTFSVEELKAKEGRNVTFSVIIPRSTGNEIFRAKTVEELLAIFARGSWRNGADMAKYINVERSDRARQKIDGDADDE